MASKRPDVLIVGAGVIGLTTALRLLDDNRQVSVVADRQLTATSSFAAGAIFDPSYAYHPSAFSWGDGSLSRFRQMIEVGRPEVRMVHGVELSREKIDAPAWTQRLDGYAPLEQDEVWAGYLSGWRYQAPIIDMPAYLALLKRLLARAGVEIVGQRLGALKDGFGEADIVVNCTGMGARELVPDHEMRPVRGELVAVENPGVTDFLAEHTDGPAEGAYLLPQGDVLLLGGSADDRADLDPDPATTQAIIDRCSRLVPGVADARVIESRIGIRPTRSIVRLETEDVAGGYIVHNYGHGGAGVSLSWGCADDVAAEICRLLGDPAGSPAPRLISRLLDEAAHGGTASGRSGSDAVPLRSAAF
jgi:D-amino-acid oxidase